MLFEFGFFWKTILLVVLSWTLYGIWGFEFTAVTTMAVMLALMSQKRSYF
jgi:hypothetical protein